MNTRASRLSDLDPIDSANECINVVIETPRGARTKLAYDRERAAFVVKKVLPQGMSFPFDFGFIPSTAGDDGDPLDVLVLMDEPVPIGTVVPSRLIGVIEAVSAFLIGPVYKDVIVYTLFVLVLWTRPQGLMGKA